LFVFEKKVISATIVTRNRARL